MRPSGPKIDCIRESISADYADYTDWNQRSNRSIKSPPWISLQIIRNRFNKRLAKILQLLFAHAADALKLGFSDGVIPGHLPQRDVRENYVGRHAALVGNLFPP